MMIMFYSLKVCVSTADF